MRARPDRETVAGSPTKQSPARPQGGKAFRFEIGWGGMCGLVVVSFCLLLWMFLLGIWAGQTILLPTGTTAPAGQPVQRTLPPPQVVVPGEKG
ncbi:MAG: hypothetical protein KAY58_01690 [Desulfobulbus sp.]|jgi:hypothetical protein|nr:hypothetical protein [Desulfobulbus sp.]